MTIEKPGFSRRRLLTTAAVGVPAMGLLGAVNLFNAPAAKAAPLATDGYWGFETTRVLQQLYRLNVDGWVLSQPASWAASNPGPSGLPPWWMIRGVPGLRWCAAQHPRGARKATFGNLGQCPCPRCRP